MDLQKRHGPGIVALRGFESMVELLGKLVLAGVRMCEMDIYVDWSARKGKSKMKVLRTGLGYIRRGRLLKRWPRAICCRRCWTLSMRNKFVWHPATRSPIFSL